MIKSSAVFDGALAPSVAFKIRLVLIEATNGSNSPSVVIVVLLHFYIRSRYFHFPVPMPTRRSSLSG